MNAIKHISKPVNEVMQDVKTDPPVLATPPELIAAHEKASSQLFNDWWSGDMVKSKTR